MVKKKNDKSSEYVYNAFNYKYILRKKPTEFDVTLLSD